MFFSSKLDQSLKPSTKNFWPINTAGKNIENKILQTFKIINKFVVLIILILIGGYFITFLPLIGDEININSLEMISVNYFGRWSSLFSFIIYIYYPVFAFGLLYPFLLVAYLTALATIQLHLLKEKIKSMADECKDVDCIHLLYNENYQNAVYQKIILCIEHHIRLKR